MEYSGQGLNDVKMVGQIHMNHQLPAIVYLVLTGDWTIAIHGSYPYPFGTRVVVVHPRDGGSTLHLQGAYPGLNLIGQREIEI